MISIINKNVTMFLTNLFLLNPEFIAIKNIEGTITYKALYLLPNAKPQNIAPNNKKIDLLYPIQRQIEYTPKNEKKLIPISLPAVIELKLTTGVVQKIKEDIMPILKLKYLLQKEYISKTVDIIRRKLINFATIWPLSNSPNVYNISILKGRFENAIISTL